MKNFMWRREKKKKHKATSDNKEDGKKLCRSFCCGSRPSVSSSSSSGAIKSSDTEQMDRLSSFAHGVVHARLEQMVDVEDDDITMNHAHRRRGAGRRDHQYLRAGDCEESVSGSGSRFIVLTAMETSSDDPKADFQRSMTEVITLRRLQEPRELRSLLNCYMSVNSQETRLVILEAFYEVCCSLFACCR